MAITTLDGAVAGMLPPNEYVKAATGTMVTGRPQSLAYLAGMPGAASAPAAGIGGEVLTTWVGQLPWTNPGSGNTYLARMQGQATIAGTLMLCDRLWQNSGITITSTAEQLFTASAQIPARDNNGTNAGVGVIGGVEVSAITGAGTPTLTLKYTNQAGTAGKTATNTFATAASAGQGAFFPIGLAAGDTGIRKAESLTLSATWTSGTIHTVLYRVLARLSITDTNTPADLDALTGAFPKAYNDTVPFMIFIPSGTATTNVSAQVIWTQG